MASFDSTRQTATMIYGTKANTTILFILSLFLVTACQSLPDVSHQQTRNKPYVHGQTTCMLKSSFSKPKVSGQVIDTPNYMLVTLINAQHASDTNGELCIIDKQAGQVEITRVNQLRFLSNLPR